MSFNSVNSVNSTTFSPVIHYNDDFFDLPDIEKKRKKFQSLIDDAIFVAIESFQISNQKIKREIKRKFTHYTEQQINQLTKKLKRNPFKDYLGLQEKEMALRPFCLQLVEKHYDAYIAIVQQLKERQELEGQQELMALGDNPSDHEGEEVSEELELLEGDTTIDHEANPYAKLLETQLVTLRQINRTFLEKLHGEKQTNAVLIKDLQEKMYDRMHNMPEIYAQTDRLNLASPPDEPILNSEILEMTRIKRVKRPRPENESTIESLEKKIKGVERYQQQLKQNIADAKLKNQKLEQMLRKEKRVVGDAHFLNGLTLEQWRRDFIPYSDSEEEPSTAPQSD